MGTYLQGWHQNTVSLGFAMQVGVGFDFGKIISIAALGEAAGGFGYPYLLEGRVGGMGEVYFLNKTIGVGVGGGFSVTYLPYSTLFSSDANEDDPDKLVKDTYLRFALILQKDNKTSFYAQRYANGDWGFGVQFGW
jgi:hypothetical protein